MNLEEFRCHAKEMVDYICSYIDTLETRRVYPLVSPGYLGEQMPIDAPERPDDWSNVVQDIDKLIMPGITHWQHPRFHAFFPSGNAFPSIMGDMMSDAIGCVGFSWASSPACAELEMVMVDWLAKMMHLPPAFLHSSKLGGGGVIQGSASDAILVTIIAARHRAIKRYKKSSNSLQLISENKLDKTLDFIILNKLVCYTSCLAHSAVYKDAMICFVEIRLLKVDENFSLRGSVLEAAIEKDIQAGLIPFYVCATLGTTGCCSFDNLEEIGHVCRKFGVWLHVDAAYAGGSFICPEFRYLLQGIENVDSLDFNPNKFMLINFDSSILWVRKSKSLTKAMSVRSESNKYKYKSNTTDFRNWSIPLSRRFRALKIWFTIRTYGVSGLQGYVRNHVKLAKSFMNLVSQDDRFEIIGQVILGLVCFRIKPDPVDYKYKSLTSLNENLLKLINDGRLLHLTPSIVNDIYIIRFCVCHEHACLNDIFYAWKVIRSYTDILLDEHYRDKNLLKYKELYQSSRNGIQSAKLCNMSATDIPLRLERSEISKIVYTDSEYNIPREASINMINQVHDAEDALEIENK